MLNEESSFYDDDKKAFYLHEYESKINELDRLLHNLPLSPIPSHRNEKPSGLKRCWNRLFGKRRAQFAIKYRAK